MHTLLAIVTMKDGDGYAQDHLLVVKNAQAATMMDEGVFGVVERFMDSLPEDQHLHTVTTYDITNVTTVDMEGK